MEPEKSSIRGNLDHPRRTAGSPSPGDEGELGHLSASQVTAQRYVTFQHDHFQSNGLPARTGNPRRRAGAVRYHASAKTAAAQARLAAFITAVLTIAATAISFNQEATLFDGAYRVDLFSQILKLAFASGLAILVLLHGNLTDIREDVKAEYYLFLSLSVSGLMMLVSSVELITLVVSLELSAFPLYLMIPMRREREGQRVQMESAIKYMMFGIAANGIMLFGMSYLFGLTGTTHLQKLLPALQPVLHTPLAIAGLALTFAGLYYKLAIFPFHFWTPDVYQGASNETASLIASLPKIGGVAVLVRLVSLASPDSKVHRAPARQPGRLLDVLRQPDRPDAKGF